eukprot:768505-Hanusia_phi.AAC.5
MPNDENLPSATDEAQASSIATTSSGIRRNTGCLFADQCLLKNNPEAEVRTCRECCNSYHVLCAARLAASDDPSGNNCGKHNQIHRESLPGQGPVCQNSVLNMFKNSAATSTGRDSNRQNIRGYRRQTSTLQSYGYRIRRMMTFFKSHPEHHGALTEAQDDLIVPLPPSAIEAFFGHLAENDTLARPRRKRMRPVTVDVHGGSGSGSMDSEDGDGAEDSDEAHADPLPRGGGCVPIGRAAVAAGPSVSGVCRYVPTSSNKPTVSLSTMKGYKSALKALYEDRQVPFNQPVEGGRLSVDEMLSQQMDAYSRVATEKESRGVMPLQEGKMALSMQEYKILCQTLRDWSNSRSRTESCSNWIFGWSCTVILWNLVSRSEALDRIRLAHVDWENDCMKILLLQTKHHQAGRHVDISEASGRVKHVFASPLTPEVCPILVLGLYTFCTRVGGRHTEASSKLFVGSEQRQRYSNLLTRCIATAKEQNPAVGKLDKACTHSFREGGISLLLSILDGPGKA